MFLGAGADKNLYRKIFGYLDKSTLALCRTFICKDWYALIAKPPPWTAVEIYQVLHQSARIWPAFKTISAKWLFFPYLHGRWDDLLKRCLEKDESGLIHWMSKRTVSRMRGTEQIQYPMVTLLRVAHYIIRADPKLYPRLWSWVIEKVRLDPVIRLELFWHALMIGHEAAFRLFIEECWDPPHMIFAMPEKNPFSTGFGFYGLFELHELDALNAKFTYLHAQGVREIFWHSFISRRLLHDLDSIYAEKAISLIALIYSVTNHVDSYICETLRDEGKVDFHNKIRPWCSCVGPVLRNRRIKTK